MFSQGEGIATHDLVQDAFDSIAKNVKFHVLPSSSL
jgi:hypothetical protein